MRLLITGGTGFIGRNLVEYLAPHHEIFAPLSAELDLLDDAAVRSYLCANRFDVVIHAATVRSNRYLGEVPDMLARNCRMFFNLARNDGLFGRMICFGSGAELHRPGLPACVSEEYFDTRVPTDAYGLSKYICAKYIERSERISNLRLFGVFGKYEAWQVRFISNACARVVHGLPIVIRKNVVFDYLYIEDLARITAWFLEAEPRWRSYNVCTGERHALTELASMVAVASRKQPPIRVLEQGDGPEYTADNSRLLDEIGGFEFRDMTDAIAEVYSWYEANADAVDPSVLQFDG